MFRNYLISALRNIIRNRVQSVIQVISLVIGITAFILIGLYARNELRVDRFNENFDRIYRLEFENQPGVRGVAFPQGVLSSLESLDPCLRSLVWSKIFTSDPSMRKLNRAWISSKRNLKRWNPE